MKKLNLVYITIVLLVVSCTKRSYIPEETYYSVDFSNPPMVVEQKKDNTNISTQSDPKLINSVIEYSKTFIGVPYKYGGTTPSGFDCSGFIMYVFKEFGVNLPRNAVEMAKYANEINVKDVKPGDLIFFKGSNAKSNEIGHVALVTEKTSTGFKIIHATSSKGIIINDFDQYEYWKTRFLFASRIKDNVLNK
jgi:cell wall-associated NlpC family hydrolase